jgi:hypothetical protein
MVSYMKFGNAENENDEVYDPDFEAGYAQSDIDDCDQALTGFLGTLQQTAGNGRKDFIIESVKAVVLRLNTVNNKCDGNLIETDQREDICNLIKKATEGAGLVTEQSDITEEWREW